MKKQNIIILILIILLITMGFTIYYLNDKAIKKNTQLANKINQEPTNEIPNGSDTPTENLSGSGTNSRGSESSSSSTTNGETTNNEEETLPNFAAERCGYYFEGYGVCSGTCLIGSCSSEGRSCYCKI